ncbi:hypothetical protein A9Q84_16415 [Halobacteriovorax marinus]|uniref:Outer membrane protein beta-barrel domain-containing protein n=1 Tax=Halobacteriovorax marinus TaxID=97084 RepID=A0A1Y5F4B4_9BACT|nr:hypothetical protein A9Q84_16415 [Halobacteriovorax marinus]
MKVTIKLIFTLFFLTFILVQDTFAGFYFQHSFNYESETEGAESLEYTAMRNYTLLGASFGKKENWVIGQSIYSWSRGTKNSAMTGESAISMLELGPRVQYFFNSGRNFYMSGTYNFYAKGTREINGGTSANIEGTSYILSAGLQLKVKRLFYIGFSYNYHVLNITETSSNSVVSTVSETYTYIFPAIEFSLRFK